MTRPLELTGKKFSSLTVIKRVKNTKSGNTRWECKCNCGNVTHVTGGNLMIGAVKSCGCVGRKKVGDLRRTHGLAHKHPINSVWGSMKTRCYNKNRDAYKYYGGKGVKVCAEWRNDYMAFHSWMLENGWEKGLQIDRIDNDGDYSPSNCRLVTNRENALNRRFLQSNNTSGYRGVHKNGNGWQATITIKGSNYVLGTFAFKENAVVARNEYILRNNLEKDYKIQEIIE